MVLSAPAALWILGPEIAPQALEFIANATIRVMPVGKILLDGKPSSPAVDTIPWAVEQASPNAQPTPAIAMLPSTTTIGARCCQQLPSNNHWLLGPTRQPRWPTPLERCCVPLMMMSASSRRCLFQSLPLRSPQRLVFFMKSTYAGAWSSTSPVRSQYCPMMTKGETA
uniref:Uncharacterized protein n=1 Tax=Romanomermis culicivorax TaxID=13658 RepID=A0A915JS11_ROMCU